MLTELSTLITSLANLETLAGPGIPGFSGKGESNSTKLARGKNIKELIYI